MAEQKSKSEILPHKKTIKLTPAIGDWTTYHPPKAYAKRIKSGLYGFDRLSEEQLTRALLLHYNFTREFLRLLQINLMLSSDFYSISGEQTNYLNFLRSANYPLVHFLAHLPEWHSAISICLDLVLVNTIINQSLGSKETDPLSRKLTDLEESILDLVLKEYFMPLLSNAFKKVLGKTEASALNSPDIITDSSLNPSNAFVYFNIGIALADNPPAKIQIGYGRNLLKNLLKKLEAVPESKPFSLAKLPATILNSVDIPISVTLGTTELGTGELQSMEPGDVVALENSLESPVVIKIGDKINVLGQPGKKGKKISSRIVSMQKEEKVKVEAAPTLEESPEEEKRVGEAKEEAPLEEIKKEEYPKEEVVLEDHAEEEIGDEDYEDEDYGDEDFLEEEEAESEE